MLRLTLLTQPPPEGGAGLRGVIGIPIATASRFTVLGALVEFFTGDPPRPAPRHPDAPVRPLEQPRRRRATRRDTGRRQVLLEVGKDIEIFRSPQGGLEICKGATVVAKLGESETPIGSSSYR